MRNPFTEVDDDDGDERELVRLAREGDRGALERLVLRHQAWVYNIAVRMVFVPQDAEEVTQEVLIKAVTRLSTFEGASKFRTWLYRITANHVLNMKRRGAESHPHTFTAYANAINDTLDSELPDRKSVPVELPLLVEEAKVACTTGMLLCLDRRQRLAFTLGEIFGATDTIGAEVMEVTADNFRKILSRARNDLSQFMNQQCGLVNPGNPCRCHKKTKGFIDGGHVDPHRLQFVAQHVQRVSDVAGDAVRGIDSAVERQASAVFRDHPFFQPAEQVTWLRQILDLPEIRQALRLN